MTAKKRDQRQYDLVQQYLPGLTLNTMLGIIPYLGDPYDAKPGLGGMTAYPSRAMAGTSRNKAGAPFQYVGSLFAALAVVKSRTGYSADTCKGWNLQVSLRTRSQATRQLGLPHSNLSARSTW